jgi:hypothetical protein
MVHRLPLIACAAYLVAAFPAYAQNKLTSHDSCGGDSCASDAYDLGYHDGYEDRSYTSILGLQNNPQYEAGFSEGEMDAMAEKDALTAGEQGSEGQPKATQRELDLLSTAMDGTDTLTARGEASDESLTAPGRSRQPQTDPTSGAIPIE